MKRSEMLMKPIDRDSEKFWELAQDLIEFADKDSIEKFMSFVLLGFEEEGMFPPNTRQTFSYEYESAIDWVHDNLVWETEDE